MKTDRDNAPDVIPRRRAMGRLAAILGTGIGAALAHQGRPAHARDRAPADEQPIPAPADQAPAHDHADGPLWIGHI